MRVSRFKFQGGWWMLVLLCLSAVHCHADPVPATTAFTRNWLTSTNQAQAQAQLGVPTGKVQLIHNGLFARSFTTITSAKSAAVAGDLIWVEAGNYFENNLLKSNVNYHFEPGVQISWTNTSDAEFGIFDDRATGTTTNIITGKANIYWRSFRETVFADAGIKLTNANTYFSASFGKIVGDSFSTNGEQPHIIDARGANSWVSITADELLTGSVNAPGQILGGVLWKAGEMFVTITHIGEFAGYGIWPSDTTGTVTNNLWVTSDLLECYVYADAASLNFRSWYDLKELRMTTNGTVKSGFAFFGGRHYVRAEKISSPNVPGGLGGDGIVFYVTNGGQVWLSCQKLTRNGYSHTALKADAGTKIYANILQIEDTTTNTTPLIQNSGELWLSGVIYNGRAPLISTTRTSSQTVTRLSGITATATNDAAAIFADTNVTIVGSSFVSSIATNAIVFSGTATNADIFSSMPFVTCVRSNAGILNAPFGWPLGEGYVARPTIAIILSDNINVADGETVTVGRKTYTFKTALTPTEGQVLRGANADATLLNLIRAINHTGTPDTDYKCAVQNADFSSSTAVSAHSLTVTSRSNRVWDVQETSAHLSINFTQAGGPLPLFWDYNLSKEFSVNTNTGVVTCMSPGLYSVRGRVLVSIAGDNADYFNLDVFVNGSIVRTSGGSGLLVSYAPLAGLSTTPGGWAGQPSVLTCEEVVFLSAGAQIEILATAVQGFAATATRIQDFDARLTISHL